MNKIQSRYLKLLFLLLLYIRNFYIYSLLHRALTHSLPLSERLFYALCFVPASTCFVVGTRLCAGASCVWKCSVIKYAGEQNKKREKRKRANGVGKTNAATRYGWNKFRNKAKYTDGCITVFIILMKTNKTNLLHLYINALQEKLYSTAATNSYKIATTTTTDRLFCLPCVFLTFSTSCLVSFWTQTWYTGHQFIYLYGVDTKH